MTDRAVEVIISVHSPARPIRRAVRSVVEGNAEHARPVVVCHNVDVTAIQAVVGEELGQHVTYLALKDGIPSPAGPTNLGIAQSSAEFVSILNSDDELEPGAVSHWLVTARRWRADAVIARIVRAPARAVVKSPPKRPFRRRDLRLDDDRLAYRSAPLGLIRRSVVERLDLRLTEGARTGEDLEFSTRLWAEGRVAVPPGGPGYVEHDDATDRVTDVVGPVGEELRCVEHLATDPWMRSRPGSERLAVAVKLARRHAVATLGRRLDPDLWTAEERRDVARIVAAVLSLAPSTREVLSRNEVLLLDLLADPAWAYSDMETRYRAAVSRLSPGSLLSSSPGRVLHPQAPLRYAAASLLVR